MASNRLSTQALWIDGGPGSMNVASLFQAGQLGQFYEKDGKKYQLVQFKSTTTTIANGAPVMWTDRANFVVSAKVADSVRNEIAGVALGSITAGNYDFIQVRGNHPLVIETGAIAAGDTVIMSSTDGTAISGGGAGTAPTFIVLGTAQAAASGGFVSCNLEVPLNGA